MALKVRGWLERRGCGNSSRPSTPPLVAPRVRASSGRVAVQAAAWAAAAENHGEDMASEAVTVETMRVQVVGVSGVEVARFCMGETDRIQNVKKRLRDLGACGDCPPSCQRLMLGCRVLGNEDMLQELHGPWPLVLTLVLLTFDAAQNELLLEATRVNNVAAVKDAVDRLADPNCAGEDTQSALHIACQLGNLDIVRLLCNAGADVRQLRDDRATPLFNAAQGGHPDVVDFLLEFDPGCKDVPRQSGATPMFVAAQMGFTNIVRRLWKAHADVNKARDDGANPLFVAAQNGHSATVRQLGESGAALNFAMGDGATPLFVAAQNGHVATVKLLWSFGADLNRCRGDGSSPLFIACQKGHIGIVRFLCDVGADPDCARKGGAGPIHILAQKGNAKALRILLKAGSDINACMQDGAAALSIAAQHGNVEIISLLCEAGANLNATRKDGATALIMATHGLHFEVVCALLAYGADKTQKMHDGTSPLQAAQMLRDTRLVDLLRGATAVASKKHLLPGSQQGAATAASKPPAPPVPRSQTPPRVPPRLSAPQAGSLGRRLGAVAHSVAISRRRPVY